MDHRVEVDGLPLPSRLLSMMATGHWRHPGDDLVRTLIPYFDGPVDFLQIESMRRESRLSLPDHPWVSASYRLARNKKPMIPVELPWLDADKMVFIAICRF